MAERLETQRGVLKNSMRLLLDSLPLLTDLQDEREIKVQLALLDSKNAKLEIANEAILKKIRNNLLQAELEEQENFEDQVIRVRTMAIEKLENLREETASINDAASHHDAGRRTEEATETLYPLQLPKIDLKPYDGSKLGWTAFWGLFESTYHLHPKLTKVTKFNYLTNALKGPAASAIAGLPVDEDHYDDALAILKRRFGQLAHVVDAHTQRFLNLQPVSRANDVTALRRLYDEAIVQIRSLKVVGDSSSNYLFKRELLNKIPEELRVEWNKSKDYDTKTIDDALEFLLEEIECRERSKVGETKVDPFKRTNLPASAAALATTMDTRGGTILAKYPCIFCEQIGHFPDQCHLALIERKEVARRKAICTVCLRRGHCAAECGKPGPHCRIRHCRGRHHTAFCETVAPKPPPALKKPVSTHTAIQAGKRTPGGVLLQTATVLIEGKDGTRRAICVLDSGSQRTFIRKELADALGLTTVALENQAIHTFGAGKALPTAAMPVVGLNVKGTFLNASSLKMEALVIPKILAALSVGQCPLALKLKSEGKFIADDRLARNQGPAEEIDLLIGSDQYWLVMMDDIIRSREGPVAQASHFGWVLNGPPRLTTSTDHSIISILVQADEDDELEAKVADLWATEHLGRSEDKEDGLSWDTFTTQITRDETGRYEVPLPWKENADTLPTNRKLAEARLKRLVKRLANDGELYQAYEDQFNSYLEEGLISMVDESTPCAGLEHYLSHHVVTRQDKTSTKRRIVFDAAAKDGTGPSLNDCLHSGSNLNPELMAVLLHFRLKKVAFIGDIEKAFLQVSVRAQDRDAIRFLWFAAPQELAKPQPRLKIFRWNRVPFGLTSSPFLLRAVIKTHLELFRDSLPDAVQLIEDSLYVDDLLGGANSAEEAARLIQQFIHIFQMAQMNMRRWLTNDEELDRLVNEEPTMEMSETLTSVTMPEATSKVLGISWGKANDWFSFNPEAIMEQPTCKTLTRRQFSSYSARIFNPLGLLSPLIINVKLQFQDQWKLKLSWDEQLPAAERVRWEEFKTSLQPLKGLKIPRWCLGNESDDINTSQLHIFCDASKDAYAAVAYLRTSTSTETTCRLLASKTRVASLEKSTIPRLELNGALLATQLSEYIWTALGISHIPLTFWSDSQVALHWIRGDATKWKQYVRNRVEAIKRSTSPSWWRHCPGPLNPADLPSRGIPAAELVNSDSWWNGPSWLRLGEDQWPAMDAAIYPITLAMDEQKAPKTIVSVAVIPTETVIKLQDYSSLTKLFRITAWIQRFLINCKKSKEERNLCKHLNVEEMTEAENQWIRRIQGIEFAEEIEKLKNNEKLPKNSRISPLRPVFGADEIIRITGRAETLLEDENRPPQILLPPNHLLTRLIVLDTHSKLLHMGVHSTLAEVRERFWIIRGKQQVASIIKKCVLCARHNARPFAEIAAPLPLDRLKQADPFEIVGVDFAGPLFVKMGSQTCKAWICLFTCAVTRAVHLELVSSISAEYFLMALTRFFNRKGIPRKFYSDNALTFRRAAKTLTALTENEEVRKRLSDLRIEWQFSASLAPWWGGFWERVVQTVKLMLRKTLGRTTLTYEEMTTTLTEVEGIVNSRPLIHVPADEGELYALTPSHLLIGRRVTSLPAAWPSGRIIHSSTKKDVIRREEYRKKVIERWWLRWRREYLHDLMQYRESGYVKNGITIGDVLLINDEKKPRIFWRYGIVTKLFPGRDGRVRAVELKTSTGFITRPIQRLYPTEMRADDYETQPIGQDAPTPEEQPDDIDDLEPAEIVEPNIEERLEPLQAHGPRGEYVEFPPFLSEAVVPHRHTRRGRPIITPKRYQYDSPNSV